MFGLIHYDVRKKLLIKSEHALFLGRDRNGLVVICKPRMKPQPLGPVWPRGVVMDYARQREALIKTRPFASARGPGLPT